MSGRRPHGVGFTGEVHEGPVALRVSDLVVLDAASAALLGASGAGGDGPVIVEDLPTDRAVAGLLLRPTAQRVVAFGNGSTLDVAKQAAAGLGVACVLVPCGSEPWRAFAPFTSVYDDAWQRHSTADPRYGAAQVHLDRSLLERVPAEVRALLRADLSVNGVEVLLSAAASTWDRALAAGGLRLLRHDDPVDDLVAAGFIAGAFSSCGLGLAHAISSPAGQLDRRTHDLPNVILGPRVTAGWGDRADWSEVAAALGTAASAESVTEALDDLRLAAGAPSTLAAAGFDPDRFDEVAARALRSSGIPHLPRSVDAAEILQLLAPVPAEVPL
ncbi:iron-containing alcohol dehydrogenase [Nakamurella sp. YIM 132087]|uniref:Iron-containing alcohol dehydrogenase n=1 Tax=Nakamurella alba TaxID=2665158 RepID=A0A7K1FMB6_9ACTN|nr:iron-containing alcohol dehydrogenase [Nakamurella alba]MTD15210.1 iron-containing alcohol dehydrogenase [Nakamurella alba]